MSSDRALRRPLLGMLAVVAAALLLGLGAMQAKGVQPFALQGRVTDQVGVLGESRSVILDEFAAIEAAHDVRMWVVFVGSFDGMEAQAWTDATFRSTGLTDRDYLFAVATDERKYAYVVGDGFPLDDGSLRTVASAARQQLAEYPDQAVLAAARTMDSELAGSNSGGISGWVILGAFAVVVAISIAVRGRGSGGSAGAWRSGDSFSSPGSGGGTRGGSGSY